MVVVRVVNPSMRSDQAQSVLEALGTGRATARRRPEPTWAHHLLAKITPALIEDVKLRRAQDVAHSAVDKDLALLKAFLNWCVARNLAASNPVRRLKLFHEDNSRLRYLSREDYDRLLKATRTIDTSPYLEKKIILAKRATSRS